MSNRRQREFVCESCIEDDELQKVVRQNLTSNRCDYCGREDAEPIACELSDIFERMEYAVDQEFTDPANELPWDGREGGYQGTFYEGGYELFETIGFDVSNDDLRDDLTDHFSEIYCYRDYFGPSTGDYFEDAWNRFKRVVKHQRRYTFWNALEEGEYGEAAASVSASVMLPQFALNIERVSPIRYLDPGTRIWRAQTFPAGQSSTDPTRYTSPPLDFATTPNRMSPGGISMFYGADEFATAKAEVSNPDAQEPIEATGVQFETVCRLKLLDLASIQRPRSFFVDLDRSGRHAMEFLKEFANEVSRKIERDRRQHLEYVPTQAFTEYVRFEIETGDDGPFHGIRYKSSLDRQPCYVIFAEKENCLPGGGDHHPQMLEFVAGSFRTEAY